MKQHLINYFKEKILALSAINDKERDRLVFLLSVLICLVLSIIVIFSSVVLCVIGLDGSSLFKAFFYYPGILYAFFIFLLILKYTHYKVEKNTLLIVGIFKLRMARRFVK